MEEHSANYYHYYTDIEEHFVRRRRKFLLVSCLDWSLISAWKESGIPLHVVLRGIDRAFDWFDSQPRKSRLVNTLFYCQQSVQECFVEYGESRVGQAEETDGITDREFREEVSTLLDSLARALVQADTRAEEKGLPALKELFLASRIRLQALQEEALGGDVPDASRLERDLQSMEASLAESISDALGADARQDWRRQAERELRPYKKRVDSAMYEKILKNYVQRCARLAFGLPAFSIHTL